VLQVWCSFWDLTDFFFYFPQFSTHFRAETVLPVYAPPMGIFGVRMTLVRNILLYHNSMLPNVV
jgi:hypothetical protein